VRAWKITSGVGLCLVGLTLLRPAAFLRPVALRCRLESPPPRSCPPSSRSDQARRAAQQCWTHAQIAVNEQRYALEAWDPAADALFQTEAWRRQQLAVDATGQFRRARQWGEQAAALARTPEERFGAALLLAQLARGAGCADEERRQARRLIHVAPHDALARLLWQLACTDSPSGPESGRHVARTPGGVTCNNREQVVAVHPSKGLASILAPSSRHLPLAQRSGSPQPMRSHRGHQFTTWAEVRG